jgi:DNA-binding winged helix-turn-helix (wHTH) protein
MTMATSDVWHSDARYVRVGSLCLDLHQRRIVGVGPDVDLPRRVFDLLLILLSEPNRLHPREELFDRLWPGCVVEDKNLSRSVWLLRKALGDERKHWIRTVTKAGYLFEPDHPIEAVDTLPAIEATSEEPSDAAPSLPVAMDTAQPADTIEAEPADDGEGFRPIAAVDHQRHVAIFGMASLLVLMAAMIGITGWLVTRQHTAPVPGPSAAIALIEVRDPGNADRWPSRLSYEWLAWKLGGIPDVALLTPSELAARSDAITPRIAVVFISSATPPNAPNQIVLRARFEDAGRDRNIELRGSPEQVPAMADALSRQVMQRLLPRREGVWPKLELNETAARRYEAMSTAIERRDWIATVALGNEVVRMAPRFGLARIQLAQAQSRLAQSMAAIEQMDAAQAMLRPVPEEVARRLRAQRLSMDPRRLSDAAAAYADLSRRHPGALQYAIEHARLLNAIGQPQPALAALAGLDADQAPMNLRIARALIQGDAYALGGDPDRMRAQARIARRMAGNAGQGWEIESADAALMLARADTMQYPERPPSLLYEEAAGLYETAGNATGAMTARFYALAASPPSPQADAQLDKLLATANAGGFRQLEVDILLRIAAQAQRAGATDEYRARLEQAAAVADAAADAGARAKVGVMLAGLDMMSLRLSEAQARMRRLDRNDVSGPFRRWYDQVQSLQYEMRGDAAGALDVALRVERELPAAAAGDAPSELRLRMACLIGEQRLALGDLAAARANLERCAASREKSSQLLAKLLDAQTEWMSGDRDTARLRLGQAAAILPMMGTGADHWNTTLHLGMLLTRLGDYPASQRWYAQIQAPVRASGYRLPMALLAIGQAENEAAQGNWSAARAHMDEARRITPASAWPLARRIEALDAVAAFAAGDYLHGRDRVVRLHQRAHELGDVYAQVELHSLLPAAEWDRCCTEPDRIALAERTGLRGATLDWLSRPRGQVTASLPVARH